MGDQPVLSLKGISKFFPGIKALDNVDFQARKGEVHALIGENGAGKSTLVKIITGVYQPTKGSILFRGEESHFHGVLEAQAAGITAIHQEASMFPELTVAENIYMGHHLRGGKGGRISPLDWRTMKSKTRELLDKMELDIAPTAIVKSLGVAQRHMVEIAKALSIDAEVVIMDEPTSALTLREVEDLYRIVRNLKEEGKAIIFISHKFDEIFDICDSYTVLRDGQYIGEGMVKDSDIPGLVQMMVGRNLDQMFPKKTAEIGEEVLKVEGLSRSGFFKDISFNLHKGEILGFFGLVGAGRSEVMRAIFGIDNFNEGEIILNGKKVHHKSAKDALKNNIGFIPEDRQDEGAVLEMSIHKNITLPQIDKIAHFGFLNQKYEKRISTKYGQKMEIRTSSYENNVNTLSGGNQQKVVIAKWLATEPDILILDEPTKGIDVGTKAAVHEFISELAVQGKAIILVSSELPEILGMSDRVVVMHEGLKTAEFSREDAKEDNVILAATGHELKEED